VEGVRTSQMWTGSSAKTCFLYFPTHWYSFVQLYSVLAGEMLAFDNKS
jgi:hypothetical protein